MPNIIEMKTTIRLLILFLTVIFFGTCRRDKTMAGGDINNVFKSLMVESEFFTFDAESSESIICKYGSKIFIQPNSFFYCNGDMVTGEIELEVKEVLTKGDAILCNISTKTTGGDLLRTGGMIYISAEQNGIKLCVDQDEPIQVMLPNANPQPGMTLYSGINVDGSFCIGCNGNISWSPIDSLLVSTINDSIQGGNFYSFFTSDLNWLNCDDTIYVPAGTGTTINVYVDEDYTMDNAAVFVVFHNDDLVASADSYQSDHSFMFGYSGSEFPIGYDITLIGIATLNGSYYSAFKDATTIANFNIELDFSPTSISEFEYDVSQL